MFKEGSSGLLLQGKKGQLKKLKKKLHERYMTPQKLKEFQIERKKMKKDI